MNAYQRIYAAEMSIFEKFNAFNLAERCARASAEDRSLIYFLQSIVLAEGGLAGFVERFKKDFPNAIAIPSLPTMRAASDGTFNADQVRILRSEVNSCRSFPLDNEQTDKDLIDDLLGRDDDEVIQHARPRRRPKNPSRYPKERFLELIQEGWAKLEGALIDFCADEKLARNATDEWWWASMRGSLLRCKANQAEQRTQSVCQTSIVRIVSNTLESCIQTGNLVVIDGDARIGKTFAVRAWCEAHPGEARYVQTPCTPNEQSFLLAIAAAIGIPASPRANFGTLRAKIESFARSAKLVLVFDEGHSLLPSSRYTAPARLQWILTALVNHGVGVALVTTPQFLKAQEQIASRTSWNLAQFVGRIFIHAKLPSKLPREELIEVARHLFPRASESAVHAIAGYAESAPAYMQAIGFVLDEARLLAKRCGQADPGDDEIKAALKTLIGSGTIIAERLQPTRKAARLAAQHASAPVVSARLDREFSSPVGARIQQNVAEPVGL